MKTFDLYNSPLFESLLEFSFNDSWIDLHNDYDVVSFSNDTENISFVLKNYSNDSKVSLIFSNPEILQLDFLLLRDRTIDNFYRGRFEKDGELLDDYQGKQCFYIDFVESGGVNFLSSTAELIVD